MNERPEIVAHDIVTRAMRRTGRDEFGQDDWSEPLEVLTRSIELEARLHHRGRRAVRAELTDLMVNRARESRASTADEVPTIIIATLDEAGASSLEAELGRTTDIHARALAPTLTSIEFERKWHVPGYAEWLAEADLTGPFNRLAAGDDGTTNLVTSALFLERIETVRDAMPLAVIVQVHHSPAALERAIRGLIARSVADRGRYSEDVQPDKVDRYWRWRVDLMMERNVASRAVSTITVVDLDQDEIEASPRACSERILSALGR